MAQTTVLAGTPSNITFVASNGGSVLNTGVIGWISIPATATIKSVTLLADEVGSIVVDIWKVPYASYPSTSANSITATDIPTITSAQSSQDTALTGWTTTLNVGDVLTFNIKSITSIKQINITLGIVYS